MTAAWLKVNGRVFALADGIALDADDLAIAGMAGQLIARVVPNPQDASVLGLRNESARAWSVALPDGQKLSIDPDRSVRLTEGLRIDFGGASGIVSTQPPRRDSAPAGPVVDKERMERLARKLHRAAAENVLSQQQFDQLHAAFFGYDDQGTYWTVGLKSRAWNRSDGKQWTPGPAPKELTIAQETFDKLVAVEQKLGGGKP